MRMRTFARSIAFFGLSLSLLTSSAGARDLVSVSVDGVRRASGSNFIDLVDDVLSQDGEFSDLSSTANYTVGIDYLGILDAFQFDASLMGQSVTLTIPSTGFSRTFTGTSADDIENQVQDFLESDGANQLANFLEEVNGRSPLAVLDGNPRSTTALLSRGAYDRFGLGAPRTRAGYQRADVAQWGHFDLQVQTNGGLIDVKGFDSFGVIDGALTLSGDFKPGVGLSFSILGQYRELDGAEVFDAGFELGVPVWLRTPDRELPIRWVVTPFLQVGAGASIDLAAGGLMMGGGVVNSISYNMSAFEFMMANELVYYGGIPLDNVGGYDFDTELDRLIMKNGGKIAYHLRGATFVETGITFTNFLVSDAAVEFYATPFIGVGTQIAFVRLRLGWESDFGDDYAAHLANGELALTF